MGIFDKKEEKPKSEISFPEPPSKSKKAKPSFPEPLSSSDELEGVKERVEKPSFQEENGKVEDELENQIEEAEEREEQKKEKKMEIKKQIPEPTMPTSVNPTLYLKLTEYKEIVKATNKMRKDIENAKEIVTELRKVEKDEHSKIEKSDELIQSMDEIISLFEKTMVTPVE